MKGLERKTGFSLIEVIIAMGVLMIGLVALVQLQVFGIQYLALARQKTVASQLAAQYLEMLKTVPVDLANPATIMFDSTGVVAFEDADNNALLNDGVIGDGINTWHRLRPVNERGEMLPAGQGWTADFQYLICYGVEWGGTFIPVGGNVPLSKLVAPKESGETELTLARFPEILPGAYKYYDAKGELRIAYQEIYIEVWVGWVGRGVNLQRVGTEELRNVNNFFDNVNTTFPEHPAVFPRHKVVLRTLRRI